MLDREAVMRPFPTPFHVTDYCKNKATNTLVYDFALLHVCSTQENEDIRFRLSESVCIIHHEQQPEWK